LEQAVQTIQKHVPPPAPKGSGKGKGGRKGSDSKEEEKPARSSSKGGGKGKGKGKGGQDELVGKLVRLNKGAWKGYLGLVKQVQGNKVRVELQGKQKTVSATKEQLVPEQGRAISSGGARGGSMGMGASCGMDNLGGRTPVHQTCATPLRNDGFRTPLHDDFAKTPLHDAYPPQTPMHDGSRTPLHDSSIWDPLAPQTPMHRPSTPSYGGAAGGGGDFDKQWAAMGDSGGFGDGGFGYGGMGGMEFGGPGGAGGFGGSDLGMARMPSPGPSSGLGAPVSPYNNAPGTPVHDAGPFLDTALVGGGAGDVEMLPERVQVTLGKEGYQGERATIVQVMQSAGNYEVMLDSRVERVTVARGEVEVVKPSKKDKVVIIRGENRGCSGVLIGIDGQDGIVKMIQDGSDIKILSLLDVGPVAEHST